MGLRATTQFCKRYSQWPVHDVGAPHCSGGVAPPMLISACVPKQCIDQLGSATRGVHENWHADQDAPPLNTSCAGTWRPTTTYHVPRCHGGLFRTANRLAHPLGAMTTKTQRQFVCHNVLPTHDMQNYSWGVARNSNAATKAQPTPKKTPYSRRRARALQAKCETRRPPSSTLD